MATLKWRKDNGIDQLLDKPVSDYTYEVTHAFMRFILCPLIDFLQRPLDREMKNVSIVSGTSPLSFYEVPIYLVTVVVHPRSRLELCSRIQWRHVFLSFIPVFYVGECWWSIPPLHTLSVLSHNRLRCSFEFLKVIIFFFFIHSNPFIFIYLFTSLVNLLFFIYIKFNIL